MGTQVDEIMAPAKSPSRADQTSLEKNISLNPARESAIEEDEDSLCQHFSPMQLTFVTISICLGLTLSMLDTSIVATALVSIQTTFASSIPVTWIALAYTLAYLGCTVHFAHLADIIGRRNAEALAMVLFVAFSIGCGFATSLEMLIALRTIQGIAGAGLYALTMVILPEIYPQRLKPMIGGVIGLVVAISGVLGPILGGVITQRTTWRWIFWLNGPVGALALIIFLVSWPSTENSRPHTFSLRRFDLVGGVLLIAASVLVVFSFQEAGLGQSGRVWTSALFLAPLIVGCICWIMLGVWETSLAQRVKITPLLPRRLFQWRVFMFAVLCTITVGFVYFTVIFTIPTQFQVVYNKSALQAGLGLLPMLVSGAVASIVGGIIYRFPKTMFPGQLIASGYMALGAGLLSTLKGTEPSTKIYGYQVLVGFGFGLTVSNVTMLVALYGRPADRAVAQGIIAQSRVLGGSIGIAASTAILGTMRRRHNTPPSNNHHSIGVGRDVIASRSLPHPFPGSSLFSSTPTSHASTAADATFSTLDTAVRAAAVHLTQVMQRDQLPQGQNLQRAYADAFTTSMRVCAIIACVSFLLALGTYPGKKSGARASPSREDDDGQDSTRDDQPERRRADDVENH